MHLRAADAARLKRGSEFSPVVLTFGEHRHKLSKPDTHPTPTDRYCSTALLHFSVALISAVGILASVSLYRKTEKRQKRGGGEPFS
jgi:hypothetical protein